MDFKFQWLKYKNFKKVGKSTYRTVAPGRELNKDLFCTYENTDVCQITDAPGRNQLQMQHE